MARSGPIVAAVVLGLLGGVAGFLLYDFTREPIPAATGESPSAVAERLVGEPRPGFELTDAYGQRRAIQDWDGGVVVLNFWATWCPPCRREIPAFIELQKQYGPEGLQIVGVAIDQQAQVQPYIESMGVNYPILVGELDAMDVSRAYGNRYGQLPYTVFIDRQGTVRSIRRGEVEHDEAEALIRPLL